MRNALHGQESNVGEKRVEFLSCDVSWVHRLRGHFTALCSCGEKKMKAKRKGDDDTTHTASTSCNVGCLLFYVVLGLILLDHMCSSSCSREAAETALTSSSVVCSSAHLFQ